MYPVNSTSSEAKLSPAHLEVLRKAAHDDSFRAELSRDPAAALAQCGIELGTELPSHVALPEKQALQGVLDDLSEPLPFRPVWSGFLDGSAKASVVN